ncbi:MAG: hypothetical protein EOP92_28080, partial [Lysobacteraceae bacterium]
MSYILEALKKAQAERQLGNAPTIHAPPSSYPAASFRKTRNPIIIGAVAGTFVVAMGAVFLLRQPAPAPAVQVASAPAPVAAVVATPAPSPAAVPSTPAQPVAPEPVAQAVKPEAPPRVTKAAAKPPAPAAKPEPAPRVEPVEAVAETRTEPSPRDAMARSW